MKKELELELELAYLLEEGNFKEFYFLRNLGLRLKEIASLLKILETAVSKKLSGKISLTYKELVYIDILCINKKHELNQIKEKQNVKKEPSKTKR